MKKNILLPLLVFLGANAYSQEVLKIQGGASVTVQPGAELTVAGGVSLDAGSTLTNNGVFTIKQNGAAGAADFLDNSFTAYNYGTGKFVFNSSGKQTVRSNNNFGRIDVVNAGLTLSSNITASKWWLATGIVATGNYKAVVSGTAATDLEAAPTNTSFANSWINGTLRRFVNPATVNSYQFAIGDTTTRHFADLDNLQVSPLNGVSYVDAVFGPKPGTDAGLNASENGTPYLAVNNGGVWHFTPNAAPASGAFDLKLYLNGLSGLSDNNFASLQRPDQSSSAAEWAVPTGSSINAANGAGRLVSDGYALRKNIGSFGQFGIATTTLPEQGTGLQGVYYSGTNLSGTPLLTRIDPTIDFELTYTHQPLSPAPGIVPEDMYSVRWTGQVQPLYSETYTFYTLSDDGVRLWVNGVKLVDNWVNQGATEKSGTITLVAGQKYDIVIEYYENTGEAVTKLYWSSAGTAKAIVPQSQLFPPSTAPATGTGLQGVYYSGTALSGAPLLIRIDTTINFELTYTHLPLSPAPLIVPEDNYSVRWTGQILPMYSETYTFYTVSDDGVRLWVNGVQLVDNWVNQGATEKSGSITLVAGQKYDIVIEYYEGTGEAVTKLYWSSASTAKAIVPKSQLFVPPGVSTPPTCTTNTSPANGAMLPSQTVTLTWEPVANATSYDVYLRVGAPLPESPTTTTTSAAFTLTDLSPATTYTWSVIPKNVSGSATGCGAAYNSSFTTAASSTPVGGGTGLQGVYYNGTALSGAPLLTRIDPTINFEFTYSHQPLSPAPGIVPDDNFSVRWTGQVQALYSETYTFYVLSDDGVRLWVNGVQLVNNWVNQGATEKGATIVLVAGQKYDIVIEYYEGTGEAVTKLSWSSFSTVKAIVPQSQLFPPAGSSARIADNTVSLQNLSPENSSAFAFTTTTISPNPVKRGQPARLQINSNKTGAAVISVMSSNGHHISNQTISLVKGVNSTTVSTRALAQGLYLISITGGNKPLTVKLLVE